MCKQSRLSKIGSTSIGPAKVEKEIAFLDEKIRHVREIRYSMNVSAWALGSALGEIHATEAWKLRRHENGTPKYTSWAGFCMAELHIHGSSANRFMGISRRFTEEQTQIYGFSALTEVMSAPENMWSELLERLDKGASCREIRTTIRQYRLEQKTEHVERRPAKRDTKIATLTAAKRRYERKENECRKAKEICAVSTSLQAQNSTIALYARRGPGEQVSKEATSIGQQPMGEFLIEGAGKVTLFVFEGSEGKLCVDWKFEVKS